MLLQDGLDVRDWVVLGITVLGTLYLFVLVMRRKSSLHQDDMIMLTVSTALGCALIAVLVTSLDPFWVSGVAALLVGACRRVVFWVRRRRPQG